MKQPERHEQTKTENTTEDHVYNSKRCGQMHDPDVKLGICNCMYSSLFSCETDIDYLLTRLWRHP